MSAHTPGPWFAVGHWVEVEDDAVPDICTCDPSSMGQDRLQRSDAELLANARLIAAAPDLLAALEHLCNELGASTMTRKARAVIRRATGQHDQGRREDMTALHVERDANMIHTELDDQGVRLICYLTNCDSDDDLEEAVRRWPGAAEVSISTNFRLSLALESAVSQHEMSTRGPINMDAKPLFDAMRAELVKMIETIDGLQFGE